MLRQGSVQICVSHQAQLLGVLAQVQIRHLVRTLILVSISIVADKRSDVKILNHTDVPWL